MVGISIFAESKHPNFKSEDQLEQQIINWINNQRSKHKLSQLEKSVLLQRTATKYVREMRRLNYLSHRDPYGNTALQRYREIGGTALRVGEIIGAGTNIPLIEEAWLKSPTHRGVILDPNWTEIGVGCIHYIENNKTRNILLDVLFSENYIANLQITDKGNKIEISGNFKSPIREKVSEPVMIDGLSQIKTSHWRKSSGFFSYVIQKDKLDRDNIFIRLGYQNKRGNIIITNILENLHLLKEGDTK